MRKPGVIFMKMIRLGKLIFYFFTHFCFFNQTKLTEELTNF